MTPVEPTVTAGTSQHGQVCTMSQRMDESVSQQDFYGNQGTSQELKKVIIEIYGIKKCLLDLDPI